MKVAVYYLSLCSPGPVVDLLRREQREELQYGCGYIYRPDIVSEGSREALGTGHQSYHNSPFATIPLALCPKLRMLCLNLILEAFTERRRRTFERAAASGASGVVSRTELVSLSAFSAESWPHAEGSRERDKLDTPMQHGHTGMWLASLYHIGSGLGLSSWRKTGMLVIRRLDRHCVLISMCPGAAASEPTIRKCIILLPWVCRRQ